MSNYAFPQPEKDGFITGAGGGLTKLEYVASQMMAAMIANPKVIEEFADLAGKSTRNIAIYSKQIAEILLDVVDDAV